MSADTLLRVEHLQAYYGKSHVLHGVDLTVGRGEIVSLLGRNGVGRSTTAKAIMGLVDCTGRVVFKGRDVTGWPTYRIAHAGIGYVPESRDIFPALTVAENLTLGLKGRRAGRWRFDGRTVIHTVEVATYPNWVGTEVVRLVEFAGDRVIYRTEPQPIDGVMSVIRLVWARQRR